MNIVEMSSYYNKQGTGDCERAKGHESQYTKFTYYQEAKFIYDYFCKLYDVDDYLLLFENKQTARLLGKCNYKNKEIKLYPGGKTVATLLHKYAHAVTRSKINRRVKPHGLEFKAIFDSMLLIWDEVKDDFIHLTIHDILETQKEEQSCRRYR